MKSMRHYFICDSKAEQVELKLTGQESAEQTKPNMNFTQQGTGGDACMYEGN